MFTVDVKQQCNNSHQIVHSVEMISFLFQNSDSSGTINSSDSSVINEHHQVDDRESSLETKKTSFVSYQSLIDDDDSGIVLTVSQTSIDKTLESSGSNTSVNTVSVIPPPRPPPRRSRSPQTGRKMDEKLGLGQKTPDKTVIRRRRSLELATKGVDDLLINLDTPVDASGDNKAIVPDSVDSLTAAFDRKDLKSGGDYVKLRDMPVRENAGNRRSSITRTPAMKLPPDVTPHRPSIRRERSPISPDEEEKGISAFDPLWGDNSPTMQLTTTEEKGSLSSVITTSPQSSNSDSLLKSWGIHHFTPGTNVQSSGIDYGKSASAIQPVHGQSYINTSPYFSPQPYVQRNLMNTQINPVNAPTMHKSSPPLPPPRPINRPLSQTGSGFPSPQLSSVSGILQPQSRSSEDLTDKSDPFADLVSLNKERTSPQPKQSQWEKFE